MFHAELGANALRQGDDFSNNIKSFARRLGKLSELT